MMEKVCNHCKVKVFNPTKFKSLWRASKKQEASEPASEEVQFTMTASELESGVKYGCSFCPLFSGIIQKVIPVRDGAQYRQAPYDGPTLCKIWLGLEALGDILVAHSIHLESLPSTSFTGGSRDFVMSTPLGRTYSPVVCAGH